MSLNFCKPHQYNLIGLTSLWAGATISFGVFVNFKPLPTQVSIAGPAELSSSTKTQIERQLVRFAQPASVFNGRESVLGVIISHKAIVVPVTETKCQPVSV